MPHIPQILTHANMLIKASLSIEKSVPCSLWASPSLKDLKTLTTVNWLSPYEVPTMTFGVSSKNEKGSFVVSFFFVDSRWQLTTPIDKFIYNTLKTLPAPNLLSTKELLSYSDMSFTKIYWTFLKQNDCDINRLMIASMTSKTPFILPYSDITLFPLGLTMPFSSFSPKVFNIDPTSSINFESGHTLTQKLCHSNGFLTRSQIYTHPEWQGSLKKPVGSWPNIKFFPCS